MVEKINPKLLNEITERIGKTTRTAYNKILKVQNEYKVDRRIAALIYAINIGINVNRYIEDAGDWELIRNATGQFLVPSNTEVKAIDKGKKTRQTSRTPDLNYLNGSLEDGFLESSDISAARINAEFYPIVYCFENSLRKFIDHIMTLEYGNDWWETKIKIKNGSIYNTVEGRKKQASGYPWHVGRNPNPIYLTDISDLKKIINVYGSQGKFQIILGKHKDRILVWIEDIELTRNVLAHNNKVAKKDRDRVIQAAKDWHLFASSVYDNVI